MKEQALLSNTNILGFTLHNLKFHIHQLFSSETFLPKKKRKKKDVRYFHIKEIAG